MILLIRLAHDDIGHFEIINADELGPLHHHGNNTSRDHAEVDVNEDANDASNYW
jgi:hypothetical protein